MDQFIKDIGRYLSISQRYLKPIPETEQQYKDAERLLEPFLAHFKDLPRQTVIQGFALLIGHLRHIRKQFDEMGESEEKVRAKELKSYMKNIVKIESLLNCFKYGEASREINFRDGKKLKKDLGLFPVDKMTIQNNSTNDKIEIEGRALDLFRALFSAYNDANEESLRKFNFELYNSHSILQADLALANSPIGTIGEMVRTYREKATIEDKLQIQRYTLAKNIYQFLRENSNSRSGKPSNWHKKLIANLFVATGIGHRDMDGTKGFIDTDNKVIGHWIDRAK